MSRTQQSFAIKSTHRFVNPQPEQTTDDSTYYNVTTTQPVKSWTNTDSDCKQGSQQGIAIRTTAASVEDFY